jgi:hypothetical protein
VVGGRIEVTTVAHADTTYTGPPLDERDAGSGDDRQTGNGVAGDHVEVGGDLRNTDRDVPNGIVNCLIGSQATVVSDDPDQLT